jgi:hypothetical protein
MQSFRSDRVQMCVQSIVVGGQKTYFSIFIAFRPELSVDNVQCHVLYVILLLSQARIVKHGRVIAVFIKENEVVAW